jgi:hypothetical protein
VADEISKLKEAKKLLEELNRLRVQMNKAPLRFGDEALLEQFKDLPRDIREAQIQLDNFYGSVSNLYSQLRNVTSEIKGQATSLSKSKGAFKALEESAQSLKLDEQGISDLNRDQVEQLQEKFTRNQAILAQEAQTIIGADKFSALQDEIAQKEEELLNTNKSKQEIANEINDLINERLKGVEGIGEQEKAIVQFALDQHDVSKMLVNATNDRLELEDKISEKMGVTGALVGGTGALMERLGMRSGIFHDAMKKSSETMRQMAKDTALQAKSFSQLQIAAKGFSIVAKGFGKALTDPAVIIGKILDGFLKVDKAATEVQQITGQNSTTLIGFNNRLATSADFLETMAELTKQTGMNAQNIFSPSVLAGAAELKNTMGLAAEEAGGLAMIAQTTGGDIDATTNAVVDQTSAFNKANRSAVSQGVVLRDVATASDSIKASFSGMPGELAKAASAARRLGMSLSDIDSIADSMLDFESSIEAELEAQLLTGKNINMAKARELALNNELGKLGDELFKNSSDIAEFGKMNRIQQEAQAKALGMTRDQLAKVAYQRALEAGMTEDQAAAAANVNAEDMKRMAVQEKLQKALDKLAQAFAPMLEILGSIVDVLNFFIKPIAGAVSLAMQLGGAFGQVGKLIVGSTLLGGMFLLKKSIKEAFNPKIPGNFATRLKDNFNPKNFGLENLKEKIGGLFSKDGADKITKDAQGRFRDAKGRFAKNPLSKTMDKGADATGKMQQKTKGAKEGKGVKSFLTGLGDGLAAIGQKFGKVIQGALALGIAGVAIGGSFALALQMVKNVDPVQMIAFAGSIALFGGALALLGNMASQIIQGAVAMGILSLAAMGFAYAFSMLEGVDINKMIAFSIAVPLLGLAAAGLGFIAPFIMAGAAAIGVLGLSLIPLAGAFALLGAVNIQGVLGSLSQFAAMTPGLLLAGPALLGLAGGLISLGVAAILGIGGLGMLGAISMMGPGLALAGSGVTALAEGVARLSAAMNSLETEKLKEVKDLIMTTAFAAPAIAATGAITSLIQGIAGGDSGGSDDPVVAKIQELIDLVGSGQIVELKLDSETISKQQMISMTKGK